MKKFRFAALSLLFSLLCTLLLPMASATGAGTASAGSAILENMHIDAQAALLMDADNDEVLYNQNAETQCFLASITKVMTCLLTVEAVDRGELSLDKVVTVSANLHTGIGEGGSTQDLKEGEQLTIRDLLACALIPSANEACNVLAETISGDIPTFVALMNQRAQELGMTGTHFQNTHGYQDENHYTTAHDVYRMAREAMKHPTFRELAGSKSYSVPATNLHAKRELHSTNALISTWRVDSQYYRYATGVKTGSTPEAGYCLVSSAEQDGKTLFAVVMGGKNVTVNGSAYATNYFAESARLLDWGYQNFSRRTLLDENDMDIAEIPVTLSKQANYVTLHPDGSIVATLPNDLDPAQFERNWTLQSETVEAPVQKGQVLGTITLTYAGKEYGTLNLVALNEVSRSELLYRLDRIQKFFDQLWVKILIVAVILLVAVLLLRRIFMRSHRRGGKRPVHSGRGSYTGPRRRR